MRSSKYLSRVTKFMFKLIFLYYIQLNHYYQRLFFILSCSEKRFFSLWCRILQALSAFCLFFPYPRNFCETRHVCWVASCNFFLLEMHKVVKRSKLKNKLKGVLGRKKNGRKGSTSPKKGKSSSAKKAEKPTPTSPTPPKKKEPKPEPNRNILPLSQL